MNTWIVLRAAGIGAYVMLFMSVAWGLVATTGALGKHVSRATATSVHQFMSTAGLVLLGVHIGGLLLDSYMKFGPAQVLVPLSGTFKPVAVGFGIVGMYAMVIVLTTSWLKKHLGTKWWRRMHILAVPAFTLALIHGLFTGTDTVRPWMYWTYVATGAIVLFLVVARGLTAGLRPERGAPPAHAKPRAPVAGREPAAGREPPTAPRERQSAPV